MWEIVVKTLADLDCVVGFDVGLSHESGAQRLSRPHPRHGADDERTA